MDAGFGKERAPTKRLIMFQVGTPHPVRREVSRTFSDPESRSRRSSSRSDATSAQPSRCRHHPLTRESRRGAGRRGTSKREVSRALSGSANPSPPPSKEVLNGLYWDDSFYRRFEHSVAPRTQEEDQCRLFQSETGYLYRIIKWVWITYLHSRSSILHIMLHSNRSHMLRFQLPIVNKLLLKPYPLSVSVTIRYSYM